MLTFAGGMIQTLLISGVLLAVGMALLLVKVLGRKDGKFSSQHIHDSQAMRERGTAMKINSPINGANLAAMLKYMPDTPYPYLIANWSNKW